MLVNGEKQGGGQVGMLTHLVDFNVGLLVPTELGSHARLN